VQVEPEASGDDVTVAVQHLAATGAKCLPVLDRDRRLVGA